MTEIDTLRQQLLDQQKLASLGLLSAGIAHEIQNPLNFVINFSKMSKRLLADLKEVVDGIDDRISENDADDLNDIIDDLTTNMEKICEHGERAINIIQSILLISRGKEGELLDTDITTLIHEYVWLAYHAQRANDKSFNITIKEDYQPDMPKMKVIPQDLSRAIINIMNNAFYAVHDRASHEDESFTPFIEVKVRLEKNDSNSLGNNSNSGNSNSSSTCGSLVMTFTDNGCGIPDDVKERLFRETVTTKPIGKGTGLGMMITHDIVVNNHKGSIDIHSAIDQGTTITITIPVQ